MSCLLFLVNQNRLIVLCHTGYQSFSEQMTVSSLFIVVKIVDLKLVPTYLDIQIGIPN